MNTLLSRLAVGGLVLLILNACGGGGSGPGAASLPSPAPSGTTVIQGVVSDDIVVGATVTATSADTGLLLGTAVTGADGTYAISTPTTAIGSGYTLSATGGTMLGQAFVGTMSAIYRLGAKATASNVTLLTTSLAGAAKSTTEFAGTTLDKFEAVVSDGIARGLIAADYHLVEPAGELMGALRRESAIAGVAYATNQHTQMLIKKQADSGGVCNANLSTCTTSVGATGEALSMIFKGGRVTADSGVLKNCRVVADFDLATQTLAMHIEKIVIASQNFATQSVPCLATGKVKLELAELKAIEAPDACLSADEKHPSMRNCVTIGSGISPTYFVKEKLVSHRTDSISHETVAVLANEVKLSRSFGAVLSSSLPPAAVSAANQWVEKAAVIFVHGFTPFGFGGNGGTWGQLPQLVLSDPKLVALNFQWRTDANYLEVAKELAKAVEYASLSTGKKVHIVAHSFGGVLARAMLQNLAGIPEVASAAAKVATLTTAGTPHSGIVKKVDTSTGILPVEGVNLPKGWGSWADDGKCWQISCYQSGLNSSTGSWALEYLKEPKSPAGNLPPPGYVNARLFSHVGNLPVGLKILVLIGQTINPPVFSTNSPLTFSTDDGLISYYGQRFVPSPGCGALLSESAGYGGAKVTERLLGVQAGVKACPNDLIGNNLVLNPIYPSSNNSGANGYRHSTFIATVLTGGPDILGAIPEVNVPDECSNANTCMHDTWLNLKKFLADNTVTCALPQLLQGNTCFTPPSVTNITPSTATMALPVTFTVTGQNLPLTAILTIGDATCQAPANQSPIGFSVTCLPYGSPGARAITVSSNGDLIDSTKFVTILASVNTNIAFVDNFDGSALQAQYWTQEGTNSSTVAGGQLTSACGATISTKNKVTFSGNTIIVEGRFAGQNASFRDSAISLVDTITGDAILIGDTDYGNTYGYIARPGLYGLYTSGSGAFDLPQSGNSNSVSVFKEYRLTLSGASLKAERGDTLAAITETVNRVLPTSIVGHTFYVRIGQNFQFCPGTFDWVRVNVQ